MNLKDAAVKYLKLGITVAALIFAYIYINRIYDQASFEGISVSPGWLVVSSALFFLSYICFSQNWLMIARRNNSVRSAQRLVFLASQPYKYLPTSLFVFSSRAVFAKKLGLGVKNSSKAQIIENMTIFIANFVLFGALYVNVNAGLAYSLMYVGAFCLLFLVFAKKDMVFNFNFKGRNISFTNRGLTAPLVYSFSAWLLLGFSFVIFGYSLGFEIDNYFELLAANTVAFSLSILAVFAPGGIGIREAVYTYFKVTAGLVILWRIQVFVLDMIIGLPSIYLIHRLQKKNTTL